MAISGPSGFLGSYLIARIEKEFDIILLTRTQESYANLRNKYPNTKIQIIDWNNIDSIKKNFQNINIFVHAGAKLPTRATANDKVIVDSSIRIVKNLCKANISLEKFLFISTLRTCINTSSNFFSDYSEYNFFSQDTEYGRSKFLTEKFLMENKNFPLIICAPAHIIGPETPDIAKSNDVLFKMLNKQLIFFTKAKYSIVHISDVCDVICKIIHLGKDGEKYLVAKENPTLDELINIAEKLDKIKKIKIKIPLFFLNFISFLFENLNKIFRLNNLPINRSTYHFIKLNKNFKGCNLEKFNLNFKTSEYMMKEIFEFKNSKNQ